MNELDLTINTKNACRNDFSLENSLLESSLENNGQLPDFCAAYQNAPFKDAFDQIKACLRDKAKKLVEFNPPNCKPLYGVKEITFEDVYKEQYSLVTNYDISGFSYEDYKKKSRHNGQKSIKELRELYACTLFNLILAKTLYEAGNDDAMRLLLNVCRQHMKKMRDYCVTYDSYEEQQQSKVRKNAHIVRNNNLTAFQGIALTYAFIFMPKDSRLIGWENKSQLYNTLAPEEPNADNPMPLKKYLEFTRQPFKMFSTDNLQRRVKEWFEGELNEAVNAYTVMSKGNVHNYMTYFNRSVDALRNHGPDGLWAILRNKPEPDVDDDCFQFRQIDLIKMGKFEQSIKQLAEWKTKILDAENPCVLDFLKIEILNNNNRITPSTHELKTPSPNIRETDEHKTVKTPEAILNLLKTNSTMSLNEVANELNKSISAVKKAVSQLQKANRLSREGNSKNGKWIVPQPSTT